MLWAVTSSENPDAGKHSAGSGWADDRYDDGPARPAPLIGDSDDETAEASVVSLQPLNEPSPPPSVSASASSSPRLSAAASRPQPDSAAGAAGPRYGGAVGHNGATSRDMPGLQRPVAATPDDELEHTAVVNPATRAAMTPSQWALNGADEESTSILTAEQVAAALRRGPGPSEQGYGHDRDGHREGDYRGRERPRYRDEQIRYSPPPPAAGAGGFGDGLAAEFRQEQFATEVQPEPRRGWRRAVLKSSFGLINPGESRVEREDRERIEQIRANVRGQFLFGVFSPRGGVGKTATTAALGSMFASLRGSEVLALDADPDSGNLAGRINDQTSATFRDILRDRNKIRGVTDVRAYTAHNADKLDVLASSKDLVHPDVYSPSTLVETVDALRGSYRVMGIDFGKRMRDPLTEAVLDLVTAVVVVTSSQYDAAKAAMSFHDYLRNTGRSQLLERSFLIISDRNPVGSQTRAARALIEDHVRNVIWKDPIYVPYDPHLHEGTVINLGQLKRPAYRAYLEATARLASWYGMPPVPRGRR